MGIAALHPSCALWTFVGLFAVTMIVHTSAVSRRHASEFCKSGHPPEARRAQGKPGARCTRGLVCKVHERNAHEHTGPAESIRPSLRSGLRLTSRSPRWAELFCHRRPQEACFSRTWRQRRAPGPHDFAVRFSHVRLRDIRVHRIPPRVRDDSRSAPLLGETRGVKPL